ncbi:MAG: hypothetical protein QY325_09350 [Flavobacteriales bacterium]|nr:MAG: hypothetical protein QY325_09350 [Flavobacteriales bacterium]
MNIKNLLASDGALIAFVLVPSIATAQMSFTAYDVYGEVTELELGGATITVSSGSIIESTSRLYVSQHSWVRLKSKSMTEDCLIVGPDIIDVGKNMESLLEPGMKRFERGLFHKEEPKHAIGGAYLHLKDQRLNPFSDESSKPEKIRRP